MPAYINTVNLFTELYLLWSLESWKFTILNLRGKFHRNFKHE